MRALVWPGTYDCKNLGDVAMLQVAVERLAHGPFRTINVLTRAPEELERFCPPATPMALAGWERVRDARILPRWAVRDGAYAPRPPAGLFLRLWRTKAALLRGKYSAGRDFLREFEDTDVVFLAGCGLLNDHFVKVSLGVLALLEMALRCGKPVALFSQGIGPMEDPSLRSRAAEVLPHVESIFVREERTTPTVLDQLGVPADKVTFTGDDAVAMAFRQRSERAGTELGFNVRLSAYSGVSDETVGAVTEVLAKKSAEYGVSLLGIPIARGNRECDLKTAERVLAALRVRGDAGSDAITPEKTAERVGRCRLVVTGSYHVAVFALAQGIPAVCLAENLYYENKFLGLAQSFGEGCVVIAASRELTVALPKAIDELWRKADELRPRLLREARRQMELGEQAYTLLFSGLRSHEPVKHTASSSND